MVPNSYFSAITIFLAKPDNRPKISLTLKTMGFFYIK